MSRRIKDIVDTTASLRYIVELGAAGMCDGPPDTVGSAERLRRLERSRAAWKSTVWSQSEDFPYSKKIFPFPVALSGNLVVLKGPICGSRRHTGEMLLLRLPSEARGIPEQLWSLDLGYERIEAISLDDSQDLLIFSRLVTNSRLFHSFAPNTNELSSLAYRISTFGHSRQDAFIPCQVPVA